MVAAAGYLYWDATSRFQTKTDDAFIAARQFAIAPKVPGYLTAVPVTDNQHVAAGDVIARIDDRDYRVALDQAEAQVAAARASIENIDAQIDVQQAQITPARRRSSRRRRRWCCAAAGGALQDLAKKGGGTVRPAEQTAAELDQQQAAVRARRPA